MGACCGEADLGAHAAELLNPVSGNWSATTSMDETQFGHIATLLTDGTVLVAGGSSGHLRQQRPVPRPSYTTQAADREMTVVSRRTS